MLREESPSCVSINTVSLTSTALSKVTLTDLNSLETMRRLFKCSLALMMIAEEGLIGSLYLVYVEQRSRQVGMAVI